MEEGRKTLTISDIEDTLQIPVDFDWGSPAAHQGQVHVVDAAGFFWEFSWFVALRENHADHDLYETVVVFSGFEWERYVHYTGAKAGDLFVFKTVENGGFRGIKLRIELTKNP